MSFSGWKVGMGWALVGLLAFQGVEAHDVHEAVHHLDGYVQREMERLKLPGCAVAVVKDDAVVFLKGYGVRSRGQGGPVTPDTVFQLGSVSKPIAATLLAILEKKGFLRLDDPIGHYVGIRLRSKHPKQVVRIKNLLSHTTGLSRVGLNRLIESSQPWARILHRLEKLRPHSLLGSVHEYNNATYGLVGDVVEGASLLDFEASLKHHLLNPLGMTQTTASLRALLKQQNRAVPHVYGRRARLLPAGSYSKGYYTVPAAGGVNSSARDMAQFIKAHLGRYPDLLTKKDLERLQAPVVRTPAVVFREQASHIRSAHYGLGFRVLNYRHKNLVYHGGWLKGFKNFLGFMPGEQVGIVVLHHSEAKFASKIGMRFFDYYFNS